VYHYRLSDASYMFPNIDSIYFKHVGFVHLGNATRLRTIPTSFLVNASEFSSHAAAPLSQDKTTSMVVHTL
jgi:hypothetical protein